MNMALLQEWRDYAYKFDDRTAEGQQFWLNYFNIEKGIYEKLLADKDTVVSGTVKELADKYKEEARIIGETLSDEIANAMANVPSMEEAFLDGINDSLKEANPIEEMDENTQVSLDIDFEKLYYNMVGCRAEWLYNLKEWDDILTEERRKELVKDVKKKGDGAKVAIRNIRRDANEAFKKMEKNDEISEDDLKELTEKVQKLTDKSIEKIDKAVENKTKEILTV